MVREVDKKLNMKRILILGGGFGGLYTALELRWFPWPETPEIILVDQHDRFVFLPLLYELLTGEMAEWEVAPRFEDLLELAETDPPVPIKFQPGRVQSVNLQDQWVQLETGSVLNYDFVVLALGGDTPMQLVPGASEHAIPFRRLQDVRRLKTALDPWFHHRRQDPVQVAVVGAGASGVELACKLADQLGSKGRIRLVDRGESVLDGFSEVSIQAAQDALISRNVQVDLNTEVVQITADTLQTRQGSNTIQTDPVNVVLWTVGTQVPAPVKALEVAKDPRGRLQVTPTLQLVNHPNVFALGDLAAVIDADEQPVPGTAQGAFQAASYCAWNLWASVKHRPLLPFRYQHLGEMLSLGLDSAVMSGLGITLTGPLGYLARRSVYLFRLPTLEHQLKVGWNWITKPLLAPMADD